MLKQMKEWERFSPKIIMIVTASMYITFLGALAVSNPVGSVSSINIVTEVFQGLELSFNLPDPPSLRGHDGADIASTLWIAAPSEEV